MRLDRGDATRVRGVVLVFPQPRDVHVERLGRAESVVVQDLVHDLLATQDLACVGHQHLEKVELLRGEFDRLVALGHRSRREVELGRRGDALPI